MNHPQEIEELPAPPIEIPQVTIRWTSPRDWFDFVKSRSLSIFHRVEYHVTGGVAKMGNLTVCERFPSSFTRLRLKHEDHVREAMTGETLRVEVIMRLEVWRVIKEAAECAGVTAEALIHVFAAQLINGADEDMAVSAAWRKETSKRRANEKPVPGKVLLGPWKSRARGKANA